MNDSGIRVRLVIEGDSEVTGFVAGADSPNDFWVTFKTQLVRLEQATEVMRNGNKTTHDLVYVNRDKILLASVL